MSQARPITFVRHDGGKRITCDQSAPPFDGKPVLIKLAAGWCEAWWEPASGPDADGEYDGFFWVCMDDGLQAEWDEPSAWVPLPEPLPEQRSTCSEEENNCEQEEGA